jgi:crotonobetainyl-CoA:carnitine CoA-transferase CaiB-like acyl-CoA transferase
MTPVNAARPRSLAGVRVLDLTRNLAGPFCTMALGDMGADVIKVEAPDGGDDTRSWKPPAWGTQSATFQSANRNKRSITLDLNAPAGREVALELATRSDVLVESFRPGALDRRGLGWEAVHERNPRLVYCSIGAFGGTGPLADLPGYDPVLQAFSGIMSITGMPDGPPVRLGIGAVDLGAALWATVGILEGLLARTTTGHGCHVETSLVETAAWWLSYLMGGYLATGVEPSRQGTAASFIAPYESFPTADGDLFVAAANDSLFRSFASAIGAPELLEDHRFATNPGRVANREWLLPVVRQRLTTRTADEWEAILRAAGVPCARVRTVGEFAEDPQVKALALIRPLPSSAVPDLRVVDLPLRRDGARATSWTPPPTHGEHTDEVLAEIGYDDEAIAALRREGAIW